jgi:hypothetical protein
VFETPHFMVGTYQLGGLVSVLPVVTPPVSGRAVCLFRIQFHEILMDDGHGCLEVRACVHAHAPTARRHAARSTQHAARSTSCAACGA